MTAKQKLTNTENTLRTLRPKVHFLFKFYHKAVIQHLDKLIDFDNYLKDTQEAEV